MENRNLNVLNNLMDKYNLSIEDKLYLFENIREIFYHDEFQKRMTDEYKHHDELVLGYHLLQVAIVTYILSKKYNKNIDLNIALKISLLHDLYTLPWQNNPNNKASNFSHQHAFRHPIESVINANVWYPKIFEKENDSKKIIDGIVHHMYPLPVLSFDENKTNTLELKNSNKVSFISQLNLNILKESSNLNKINNLSLKRSSYKEGKLVSYVDKLVSIDNFDINSFFALLTGYNKNLDESRKIKK